MIEPVDVVAGAAEDVDSAVSGSAPTKISADDLFRLRLLHDVRITPMGDRVAVSIHAADRDRDGYQSAVQVISIADGAVRSLSPDGVQDRSPRWAPDGRRLAFVSDRSGSDQLWVSDDGSSPPRQLTDVPGGVGEPAWSPDGRAIAFVSASTSVRSNPESTWTVETARFKVDSRPVDGSIARRHLWIVEVGDGRSGGDARRDDGHPARQLTDGDWQDSGPTWAPDATAIAFLSNRRPDREFTEAAAIHVLDLSTGSTRELRAPDGPLRALAWAPDGSAIAAIGHRRGDAQGVDDHILLFAPDGAEPRSVTAHLGLSAGMFVRGDDFRSPPSPLAWSASGDRLFTCTVERGRPFVGSLDLDTGAFTPLTDGGAVLAFSVAGLAERLAWIGSTTGLPGEIYLGDAALGAVAPMRLTRANPWLRERTLAVATNVRNTGVDGSEIEGWLYRHPDVGAGPAPLVLTVHGGPHYPVGERFSLEWQRLAALGVLVLAPNPRGSQGYGEAYATATWGDWGGGDYRDLVGLVDSVAASGAADAGRLGITGVSYGGFMTNWAISHSDRFRAAIAENSISDLWSAFGVSGEHCAFWISDMAGAPWDVPDRYAAQSPITHVAAIRTPLLLIHAENDHNCPVAQSEELFVALRYLGRAVEFLRLPGEGHLMNLYGRPSRRLARIAAIDAWWRRYLLGSTA